MEQLTPLQLALREMTFEEWLGGNWNLKIAINNTSHGIQVILWDGDKLLGAGTKGTAKEAFNEATHDMLKRSGVVSFLNKAIAVREML